MERSNYEQMKRKMQAHFLEYDQAVMIRRFCLNHDESFLYIRFVDRKYRISRRTGLVEWLDDHPHEADYNEAMTIYDVLCDSREGCALSGEFVPVSVLSRLATSQLGHGSMFDGDAGCFAGRTEALSAACEQLGGIRVGQADVGYQLNLFDFLPVRLAFWDADEEFPPSLNLLWDRNLLDFMHYETSFFAAGHLFRRLRELMDENMRQK